MVERSIQLCPRVRIHSRNDSNFGVSPFFDRILAEPYLRHPCDHRMTADFAPLSFEHVIQANRMVHQRLLRVTSALDLVAVPYAIAGDHAVAYWVSQLDRSAVRNCVNMDLLVRRADLESIKDALSAVGFEYRHTAALDMFVDGPNGRPRDGIHLIFAGEVVRPGEVLANPDVTDSEASAEFRVLALRPLVGIKLTAYRDKDRTHLRDLLDVELIDGSWADYYPAALADRLRALVDTPGG